MALVIFPHRPHILSNTVHTLSRTLPHPPWAQAVMSELNVTVLGAQPSACKVWVVSTRCGGCDSVGRAAVGL